MAGMGLSFISMHTMMLELATGKLVTLNVTGLPIVQRLVCRSPARQEALAHRPGIPCFPARAGRGDHDEGVGSVSVEVQYARKTQRAALQT